MTFLQILFRRVSQLTGTVLLIIVVFRATLRVKHDPTARRNAKAQAAESISKDPHGGRCCNLPVSVVFVRCCLRREPTLQYLIHTYESNHVDGYKQKAYY
jgi:hypothetical protein